MVTRGKACGFLQEIEVKVATCPPRKFIGTCNESNEQKCHPPYIGNSPGQPRLPLQKYQEHIELIITKSENNHVQKPCCSNVKT